MSQNFQLLPPSKPVIAIASISGLLLVIMIALGVIGGEESIEPGSTDHTEPAIPANSQLITLVEQTRQDGVNWQGSVRSRQAVKILPRLNARILEMAVHPGDRLKKGQIIARLDDRDLRAAHNAATAAQQAANAEAERASSDEKRISDLYQQQAATRQNYELALANAQAARAHAKQAASNAAQSQVLLNENLIIAPFDGTVGERFQDPGDMASTAQALVTFYQAEDLRLETSIAGQCAAEVQLGQVVPVRIEGLNETINGTIDEIAPDLDPISHSRLLKIKLPINPQIQHGQFGWLVLGCQSQHSALLIPASAIVHFGQLETVRVVVNNRVQTRHIRTGKHQGDLIEVLSGLHAGETIIAKAGAQ